MDSHRLVDLVAEHRETLHTYVSYRVDRAFRRREPVSDIVQSALREVLANPGNFTYQGDEAFRAFLIRAVENKILNKRRHWEALKRSGGGPGDVSLEDPVADGTVQTPSEVAAHQESLSRLAAALEKLPEEERRLLAMRRFAGLSIRAIADELGVSASKVRDDLARIMTKLGRELGGEHRERDS